MAKSSTEDLLMYLGMYSAQANVMVSGGLNLIKEKGIPVGKGVK